MIPSVIVRHVDWFAFSQTVSENKMADAPAQTAATGSPSDFLKTVVGQRVMVRLVSGVDYRGEP